MAQEQPLERLFVTRAGAVDQMGGRLELTATRSI
jgi:hypothetical protein